VAGQRLVVQDEEELGGVGCGGGGGGGGRHGFPDGQG
jgi:hypothetical protein